QADHDARDDRTDREPRDEATVRGAEDDLHREPQRGAEDGGRESGEQRAPVAQARGDARDHVGEAEARDEDDDGAQARVEQPLRRGDVGEHGGDDDGRGAEHEEPAPPVAAGRRGEHDADDERYRGYRERGDRRGAQEVVEPDRDPLLEQDRDPEGRQGVQQERQEDDPVVEALVLAQRAHDSDEHADDDREHGRGRDELEGHDQRRGEQLAHGLVRAPRKAEVALADRTGGDSAEPLEVAHGGRRVEVEQCDALGDQGFFVGGGARAQVLERVDGDVGQDEDEERRDKEDRYRRQEPPEHEVQHGYTTSWTVVGPGSSSSTVAAAYNQPHD